MLESAAVIDLHCHLLPGVDDGSEGLAESIEMAQALQGMGFSTVCCTPHVPYSMFTHSAEELQAACQELQASVKTAGLAVRLCLGGEHHASEVLELVSEDRLLRYPRRDTFLLEFSLRGFPPRVEDMFFRFQVKQLKPVLAHVERYPEVQADVRALAPLRERGCLFLVNLSSLSRHWDKDSQATARAVVTAGLVDAVSSDLHDPGGAEAVAEGLEELARLVTPEVFHRLTETIPADILGLGPPAGE